MKSVTACARLQAQAQALWPGAIVERTEYQEFIIRRGITAGTWRGWHPCHRALVLSAQYPEATAVLAGLIRAHRRS